MGVAFISWCRFLGADGVKTTVPAPSTDGAGTPWLWQFLAEQAAELRRAGFTVLQLPPAGKAQGGAGVGCDGYGVFDPRDLGSKDQQGSIPTRYGTREMLTALVGTAHACGMEVYLDIVLHQRIGANAGAGTYRYLGSDGRTQNGRGAMNPGCFRGVAPADRPEDAVPNVYWDISFGDEIVYQNCDPAGYTINDALDWGDWLFRTTGADGGRVDDVKGTWAPFIAQFMNSRTMAEKLFYSEYFDGISPINYWATEPPISGRSLVEDFPMHFSIQAACESLDATILDGCGFAMWQPNLAVTFVENPDTDLSPGEAIISSKLLGYAFMLTVEGYPFVYSKDYYPSSVWPGAYGLQEWIDNLVWIHENLANGPTVTQYMDSKVIVLNRTGAPGLLTALNFDTWNRRTITCPTSFGPNVHLHDYTGRHADIYTADDGAATFTIPSNAYESGQSYLCFSVDGQSREIEIVPIETTQTIFGANDLDIGAAKNGVATIGRIWIQAGTRIQSSLQADRTSWTETSFIEFKMIGPNGQPCGGGVLGVSGDSGQAAGRSVITGWHAVQFTGNGLPQAGSHYEYQVTYTGTQGAAVI